MNTNKKKDFRRNILFIMFMMVIYTALSYIPTPFVKVNMIKELLDESAFQTSIVMSTSRLSSYTLMTTGLSSYITASIILQLLKTFSETVNEWYLRADSRVVIKRASMILAVIISFTTSLIMTYFMNKNESILTHNAWYVIVFVAIYHALGTVLAVQIGESITNRTSIQGTSILLLSNILGNFPAIFFRGYQLVVNGMISNIEIIALIITTLVMFYIIVQFENSYRHVKMKYSSNYARGNSIFNKEYDTLKLKINQNGITAVILANSFVMMITLILKALKVDFVSKLEPGQLAYYALVLVLLVLSSMFYKSVSFDAYQLSKYLSDMGAVIPGVKAGEETEHYLDEVNNRLNRLGIFYMLIVMISSFVFDYFVGYAGILGTTLILVSTIVGDLIQTVKLDKDIIDSQIKY